MAPARTLDTTETDDPVTAEYEVYLTPPTSGEKIYLIQYPNRSRERPYNDLQGAGPATMRVKPRTGYMEVDVPLSTKHNFNRYQGLKWGDAMKTAHDLQNESATFGLASGFTGPRGSGTGSGGQGAGGRGGGAGPSRGGGIGVGGGGAGGAAGLKDAADRELDIDNDLADFREAEGAGKVMASQTLGGQVTRHASSAETGKPRYFVGAFQGGELHLSLVHGAVQMRPQFHHVDAEEQRNRIAASREHAAAALAEGGAQGAAPAAAPKSDRTLLQQTFKSGNNPRGDLDQRQKEMEEFLKTAGEEKWVPVEYVDEDADTAYEMFHNRLFVKDVKDAPKLQSAMDDEAYLDAISAPREGSPTRRRKRRPSRRKTNDEDEGADEG